jgi:hypothetical protein
VYDDAIMLIAAFGSFALLIAALAFAPSPAPLQSHEA